MQAIRSNPSFVNRDARVQEQAGESEDKGKDVENGLRKDDIEEVPRTVSDAEYVVSSSLHVRGLTHCIG